MGRLAALCALLFVGVASAQEAPPAGQVEQPLDAAAPIANPEQERIRYLDIDLQLRADGTLRVTEKITVWAQRDRFREGIHRDLGGQYFDLYSGMKSAQPQIRSASLNGAPVDFRSESIAEGIRVHIGESGPDLPPGQHDFELHYEIPNRIVNNLANALEWELNAAWSVPVEKTQISIQLPADVDRSSVKLKGSERSVVEIPESGPLWVLADGKLLAQESLSFDLSYKPGVSAQGQSAWSARWQALPSGHRWAIGGVIALWGYFLLIWWQVGRDPSPGRGVLMFGPPEGISPGGLRLIERLSYDPKCLVADIIALATSGHLRIERDAAGLTLHREADPVPDIPALAKLKAGLFDRSDSLRMTRANGVRLRASIQRHSQALMGVHERSHFVSNFRYWWPALLIAALTLATLVLLQGSLEVSAVGAFMAVWLTGWSFGVYVLVSQAWMMWRSARSWGGHVGALFISLFSIPFVIGELFGLMVFTATTGIIGLAIIAALLVALIGFYHWLKAPTAAGRALLDQVDGLREHLRKLDPWQEGREGIDRVIGHAYALGESDGLAKLVHSEPSAYRSESDRTWFRDASGELNDPAEVIAGVGEWLSQAVRAGIAKRRKG